MTAHDAGYLARQISKTENWVKRNAGRLPHSKAGRTYYWTDEDVVAVLEFLRRRPVAGQTAATGELRPLAGRRTA